MNEKKDAGEIVSVPRAVLDRLHGAVALMQDGSNAKGLAIVEDVLAEVGECRSPDSLTQERDALRVQLENTVSLCEGSAGGNLAVLRVCIHSIHKGAVKSLAALSQRGEGGHG